ncbi:hypothetical protein FNW52_02980 [Flavobacterium sp. ZT3R18]|uniref:hypothetical protein n=1 Tax=Flavobacterium sp. ZT3R18 TaxID=2594429 RepID=UPI00117A6A2F|nr:hypothetical protein [Flavobacterium sp. ZT3R18]TRX37879.1 hypothetical protein FNW52_02980 [Flavobacterium sp. ZT3R18]
MEFLETYKIVEGKIEKTGNKILFSDFMLQARSEFRTKAIELMQLTNEDFNKIIFEYGCKMEAKNTHKNSKGIIKEKVFWDWFNKEIDCFCFQFVDVCKSLKTAENFKAAFLGGLQECFINQTKTADLTELIKL